jgi:hypothetical protein
MFKEVIRMEELKLEARKLERRDTKQGFCEMPSCEAMDLVCAPCLGCGFTIPCSAFSA